MRRSSIIRSLVLGIVVAMALTGHALAHNDDQQAPPATGFQAILTGRAEVPPTSSVGLGLASFLVSRDGTTLYYSMLVTGASSTVSAAHIHLGHRGQNGEVVANLCGAGAPACATEGVIASGSITSASLVGPLTGHPLTDLLSAMRSGGAYTNVHTTNFPNGELRGQIAGLGAVAQAVHNNDGGDDNHGHHDDDQDDHGDHDD